MPRSAKPTPAHPFERDPAGAGRVVARGHASIVDRGHPADALSKVDGGFAGRKAPGHSLLDLMRALPDTSGIEFEPTSIIDPSRSLTWLPTGREEIP